MKKVKGFFTIFLACLMLLGSALAVSAGDGFFKCNYCDYRAVYSKGLHLYECGHCGRTGSYSNMVKE